MTIENEEQTEPCPDWEPREHIRPEEEKYRDPRYCNVCKSLHWETTGNKSSEVDWEDEKDDSVFRSRTFWCYAEEGREIEATVIFKRRRNNRMSDLFFKVISRDDPMFKDRSWNVLNFGDSISDNKVIEIPVSDGLIRCDICGEKIESLAISLLRQKVGGDEIGLGAVCNECKRKYHSDVPTRLIKLRGLPSLKKM